MIRGEIRDILDQIDILAKEIEQHVPSDRPNVVDFRSDLAGLLVVSTCATYETCVKEIVYSYTGRQSQLFKIYAENKYEKINSKIDLSDLHNYAKTFSPQLGEKFKSRLSATQNYFMSKTNVSIKESYSQLLKWRHSFAHTGTRVTTIEEVLKHHGYGKRVIFAFADAFLNFPPA